MNNKIIEICCTNCGVVRVDEIDIKETQKRQQGITKRICPVCSCPNGKILKKRK